MSTTRPVVQLSPCNVPGKPTGKLPARGDPRALAFAKYLGDVKLPGSTNFWKKRTPFPARTFGNTAQGCCTIASQAQAATRMERKEQARTLNIATAEVLATYYRMTEELYGGGDTGAYETDALSRWRNPATSIKDTEGNALTIDAFTRVNLASADEFKAAIFVTGAMGLNGLKLCLNLPTAWSTVDPAPPDFGDKPEAQLQAGHAWDLPRDAEGKPDRATLAKPEWQPYSWGGHSLYADEYATVRVNGRSVLMARLVHTWYGPDDPNVPAADRTKVRDEQWVTHDAIVAFSDEVHAIVDSADRWKRKAKSHEPGTDFDVAQLVKDVNKVSRTPVGGKRRK